MGGLTKNKKKLCLVRLSKIKKHIIEVEAFCINDIKAIL